jgi:hypothetical protein
MSLLTGAMGEPGSIPVTSMVYAPGASPSMVVAMVPRAGRSTRDSARRPVSLVTAMRTACRVFPAGVTCTVMSSPARPNNEDQPGGAPKSVASGTVGLPPSGGQHVRHVLARRHGVTERVRSSSSRTEMLASSSELMKFFQALAGGPGLGWGHLPGAGGELAGGKAPVFRQRRGAGDRQDGVEAVATRR